MISERIRAVRKNIGLSQADFGKELGVSRDVIGNIEYNRVEPKEVFMQHLCVIYGVNYSWLISGTGDMFDKKIQEDNELSEVAELFLNLNPKLRKYALQQIKGLLEVQNFGVEHE